MAEVPCSRLIRKGRVTVPGQIYLLTAVTDGRRRHFADFWLGCAASRALALGSAWPNATLLAWVLMPDHLHVLAQCNGSESISLSMGRAKALMSAAVRRAGEPARIWQPGFHDHALRTEESVRDAARYLVANPIRAGLAARVGDYPFWDSVWLEHGLDWSSDCGSGFSRDFLKNRSNRG